MKPATREVVSAASGAAAAAAAVFAGSADIPMLLSAGIAVGTGVGVWSVMRWVVLKPEYVAPGVTKGEIDLVVAAGMAKVDRISRMSKRVEDHGVKAMVTEIVDVCKKTFAMLPANPENVPAVREFIEFHMDKAISVIDGYLKVEMLGASGFEAKGQVVAAVTALRDGFVKYLVKMVEDDVAEARKAASTLSILMDMD